MYGMDFFLASNYNIIAVILSFFILIIASITDFQKREVADWVNYGLFVSAIALRLIFAAITLDKAILLDGFFGFLIYATFGLLMFYTGQWGGGDTKLIIGLGTLFGMTLIPFNIYTVFDSLLVSFLINLIFVGSLYGLIWSLVLVCMNIKGFLSKWSAVSKSCNVVKIIALLIGMIPIITWSIIHEMSFLLIMLGITPIVLIYVYIFTKSIERTYMVRTLSPEEVTEGDWIDKEVFHKGKLIVGPKDLGISKKQIALLKKFKISKVPVKMGIPFVPSFLLTFIVTFLFGNVINLILMIVFS
jgi:Flp pilus assembly protein protease CpaA